MFHINVDFNMLQVIFRIKVNLGQLFLFDHSLANNAKVFNSYSSKHPITLHFSYFKLEKSLYKCCLKISRGISIWIGNTNTNSIGLSYKTNNIDISSIGIGNNLKTSKKWKLQCSWNGTIVLTNKKITKVVCFECYNHKTMACNN